MYGKTLSQSLSAASLGGSFKVGPVRAGFYLSASNTLSILFGTILFGAMQGLWGRSAESLWPLDVRSTLCQWWQPKSLQTWADALRGGGGTPRDRIVAAQSTSESRDWKIIIGPAPSNVPNPSLSMPVGNGCLQKAKEYFTGFRADLSKKEPLVCITLRGS